MKRSLSMRLALFVSFFCLSQSAFAVSETQETVYTSTKGYSIDVLPVNNWYIAAGTYYDKASSNYVASGYHFMLLDGSGNVLVSKIHSIANSDYELRVADIVDIDQRTCWVIMEARALDPQPGSGQILDYVYAEKVDISTGNMSTTLPNNFSIKGYVTTGEPPLFRHIYPTQAVYTDQNLYICGYVLEKQISLGDKEPTDFSMGTFSSRGKMSAVMKVNLGTTATLTDAVWWNTANGGYYDFDMATRMTIADNGQDLLVTGITNGYTTHPGYGNDPSCILAARIKLSDLSASVTTPVWSENSVQLPWSIFYPDPIARGYYGIDIYDWGPGGALILSGQYEYGEPMGGWNVIRVDANMQADLSVPAGIGFGTTSHKDWPKQIFDNGNPHALTIIGERMGYSNPNCPPTPPATSSPSNVNPFVSSCSFSYSSSTGLSGTWMSDITQMSLLGTNPSAAIDYLTPTPSATGTNLEDVTKRNTFATYLYNDVSMITPVINFPSLTYLNTKYLNLDVWGNETTCNNQYSICAPPSNAVMVTRNDRPTRITHKSYLEDAPLSMNTNPTVMNQNNCTTSVYKPTNIETADNTTGLKIYPNPATDELNLAVGASVKQYSFTLLDVTGKVLLKVESNTNDKEVVNVKLPSLSSGIYMGTLKAGDETFTEKVMIK